VHCETAEYYFKLLEEKYPNLNITRLESRFNSNNRDIFLRFAEERKLPLATPMLAVSPNETLIGDREIKERFEGYIWRYKRDKGPCHMLHLHAEYTPSKPKLGGYLSMMAIVSGGLMDGINPCAFAVLIFFIAYLKALRQSKLVTTWAGIAYIAGVFITYLLLGMGLLGTLQTLNLGNIVQLPIALFAMIMGIISFIDAYKSWRGRLEEMVIKMPQRFKDITHKLIRQKLTEKHIFASSFVLGAIVASFELPCTGQIYLPILSMLSHFGIWAALPSLLLYNFFFILPLIGVFVIAQESASSMRLQSWVKKHVVLMKILTGVFLVALGLYLLWINNYLSIG